MEAMRYFVPTVEACLGPTLYFDGACRGNPGVAGIGFVLYAHRRPLQRFSYFLGYNLTNNVAEYKALISGLQLALDSGCQTICAYGDSELVCKQVNGEYRVRDSRLMRYHKTIMELLGRFVSYSVMHIPRESNVEADMLANQGIDKPEIDQSADAVREVIQSCSTPQSTKDYILKKRCEGVIRLKFILDSIQHTLPNSYAAVKELCIQVKQGMKMEMSSHQNICMSCLLTMY